MPPLRRQLNLEGPWPLQMSLFLPWAPRPFRAPQRGRAGANSFGGFEFSKVFWSFLGLFNSLEVSRVVRVVFVRFRAFRVYFRILGFTAFGAEALRIPKPPNAEQAHSNFPSYKALIRTCSGPSQGSSPSSPNEDYQRSCARKKLKAVHDVCFSSCHVAFLISGYRTLGCQWRSGKIYGGAHSRCSAAGGLLLRIRPGLGK